MRLVLSAAAVLLTSCATTSAATGPADVDVKTVAETYLDAISGKGDESGRDLLLGGSTLNATLFALENWRIVRTLAPRREEADLGAAAQMVHELDQASREAAAGLLGVTTSEEPVEMITPEVAKELMRPTQASADRFVSAFPLMAHVLRVGEAVYWNPKNPARTFVANAPSGGYLLDLQSFEIETIEGPRKVPRTWKLGVLRFKTAHLDTGWKVLPAADWNAE